MEYQWTQMQTVCYLSRIINIRLTNDKDVNGINLYGIVKSLYEAQICIRIVLEFTN